jgi:hypothetical protein
MKVQISFWTCHEHDVIITICCGFDELSETSLKKKQKKKQAFFFNIKDVEHISHSSIIQSKKIETQNMLLLKFII